VVVLAGLGSSDHPGLTLGAPVAAAMVWLSFFSDFNLAIVAVLRREHRHLIAYVHRYRFIFRWQALLLPTRRLHGNGC
jgi:hypothetical protein